MSTATSTTDSPPLDVATVALGAVLGGILGGAVVVGLTIALKGLLDYVSAQPTAVLIAMPVVGVALTVLILRVFCDEESKRARRQRTRAWRTFPEGAIQADITGDVVTTAGVEERFPWRLMPVRTLAIFSTVGLGGGMGTEAPAAYFGVAVGAALGDRGRWWRKILRPAALSGGAAGVAALMAIPFVGTFYMLELGRRHRAPLSAERVAAVLIGGLIGWQINVRLHVNLIRLIVPKEPPTDLYHALVTALFIGALSGTVTSLAAAAVNRAKKWQASPGLRLAIGGVSMVATALMIVILAAPSAAVGPGGGAIVWAENSAAAPMTLLAVAILRAIATTSTVAAGGCGGVFVPFLAIGDLTGRVFAPGLGIGDDLSGAAGAAGGIAGGYRLPLTAAAMVLWLGGPPKAMVTCFATVVVAYLAAQAADAVIARIKAPAAQGRPSRA